MNNGYIKLHRKLINWEWYTDQNTFKLFIHCLLMANHKPNKWRGIVVDTGEFITSYDKLRVQTGLSIQQVRTSLKRLILTQEIEHKSTSQYSVIKVLKYSDYQSLDDETNKQNNKQLTSNQQATNKQLTTNKNDKNDKNDKNKEYIVDYLNSVCGTSFKSTSKSTQSHINARLDEGFTVDDFKEVIDKKFDEWGTDEKMSKFLRPQTLFGTKFESYLNQKAIVGKNNSSIDVPDYMQPSKRSFGEYEVVEDDEDIKKSREELLNKLRSKK